MPQVPSLPVGVCSLENHPARIGHLTIRDELVPTCLLRGAIPLRGSGSRAAHRAPARRVSAPAGFDPYRGDRQSLLNTLHRSDQFPARETLFEYAKISKVGPTSSKKAPPVTQSTSLTRKVTDCVNEDPGTKVKYLNINELPIRDWLHGTISQAIDLSIIFGISVAKDCFDRAPRAGMRYGVATGRAQPEPKHRFGRWRRPATGCGAGCRTICALEFHENASTWRAGYPHRTPTLPRRSSVPRASASRRGGLGTFIGARDAVAVPS